VSDVLRRRVRLARHVLEGVRRQLETSDQLRPAVDQVLLTLADVERHFAQLHRTSAGGRPRDGLTRAELLREVFAIAVALETAGQVPTLGLVANRFGLSQGGLEKALRRKTLSWSTIKLEARRQSRRRSGRFRAENAA
jgi:hypothetical protein